MDKYTQFINLMESVLGKDDIYSTALSLYTVILESSIPLRIPDSMHQNCAFDYKGIFNIVPTANGTNSPDCVGNYKYGPAMAGPTRNIGDETKKYFGKAPQFKKYKTVTSTSIDKMIDKANSHIPQQMPYSGIPYSAKPMVRGFSTTSYYENPNIQGVTTITTGTSTAN